MAANIDQVDLLREMTLKLINLNVWLGGKLMPQILELLSKEKPDILTTQEAYNESDPFLAPYFRTSEVLKQNLSLPYTSFEPSFYEELEGKKIDRGNLTFSKFPIREKDGLFIFGSYGKVLDVQRLFHAHPRNMQRSLIDIEGKLVNVYNLQGIYGTHGFDTPERIEMCRVVGIRRLKAYGQEERKLQILLGQI